eukprot:TRINITY_DN13747_c0_g1_i1.p1 TRINITY_DN13747_c0_g1~~TRINITY_DN13747_c0_g1_i1.p1  ORF type:complete len:780 (+),score=213.91 TRINITY_DN13747_c0_g1_i1:91-2340(+)
MPIHAGAPAARPQPPQPTRVDPTRSWAPDSPTPQARRYVPRPQEWSTMAEALECFPASPTRGSPRRRQPHMSQRDFAARKALHSAPLSPPSGAPLRLGDDPAAAAAEQRVRLLEEQLCELHADLLRLKEGQQRDTEEQQQEERIVSQEQLARRIARHRHCGSPSPPRRGGSSSPQQSPGVSQVAYDGLKRRHQAPERPHRPPGGPPPHGTAAAEAEAAAAEEGVSQRAFAAAKRRHYSPRAAAALAARASPPPPRAEEAPVTRGFFLPPVQLHHHGGHPVCTSPGLRRQLPSHSNERDEVAELLGGRASGGDGPTPRRSGYVSRKELQREKMRHAAPIDSPAADPDAAAPLVSRKTLQGMKRGHQLQMDSPLRRRSSEQPPPPDGSQPPPAAGAALQGEWVTDTGECVRVAGATAELASGGRLALGIGPDGVTLGGATLRRAPGSGPAAECRWSDGSVWRRLPPSPAAAPPSPSPHRGRPSASPPRSSRQPPWAAQRSPTASPGVVVSDGPASGASTPTGELRRALARSRELLSRSPEGEVRRPSRHAADCGCRCPSGHQLTAQPPQLGELECSVCGALGAAAVYAGCRSCDYDLCGGCAGVVQAPLLAGGEAEARVGLRVEHAEHGKGAVVGWRAGGMRCGDTDGGLAEGAVRVRLDSGGAMCNLDAAKLSPVAAHTVALHKPPGTGSGAICGPDLVLRDVVPGSAAEAAGCRQHIGRRLTHISGEAVRDIQHACALAQSSALELTFS